MKVLSFDRHSSNSPLWANTSSAGSASVTQRLAQAWKSVVRFMTESSDEPHIWMSQDNNGQPVWNAVDPVSGRRLNHATQEEVLVWLENRYYAS